MPDDHPFPTVTQYASPDLIAAFCYEGRAAGDDPRWAESGASNIETYGRWSGHMCGIACLRMALLARKGEAPTMFELLEGARKYGAYTEDSDTAAIRGLIYTPFVHYVLDVHPLNAQAHPNLTMPDLLTLLDKGYLVMASVHSADLKTPLPERADTSYSSPAAKATQCISATRPGTPIRPVPQACLRTSSPSSSETAAFP